MKLAHIDWHNFLSLPVVALAVAGAGVLGLLIALKLLLPILLFFVGAFSYIYNRRYKGLPIGFELVTLTTLIIGIAYGPLFGAFFGLITAAAAYRIGDDFGASVPFYIVAAGVVGLAGGLLPIPAVLLVIAASAFTAAFGEIPSWIGPFETKLYALLTLITHVPLTLLFWSFAGKHVLALALL